MGNEKDRSLRNGVIAAIIGAVALPVLAWLFGWLGAVLRGLVAVGRFLATSSSVPRWLIVLLALIFLPPAYLMLRQFLRAFSATAPDADWRAYGQDVFPGFDGVVWRWRYSNRGDTILGITAFCPNPKCDMQLSARYQGARPIGYFTTFICEHCRWKSAEIDGSPDQIQGRVERLIHRKLRTDEWKSTVQQPARRDS
jgi:hypothetical protein